eukprot:g23406.t1
MARRRANPTAHTESRCGELQCCELQLQMEAKKDGSGEKIHDNLSGACANASEWLQALHIFSQMTELAGLSPDVQCWNASIFACTRAAQWTMALEFLWLGSSKANAITLGACISVCEGVLPRTTLLLVSWVTQLVEEQLAEMSQIGTT